MKLALKPFLIFLILLGFSTGGYFILKNFKSLPQKASLLVETPYTQAQLFLNDEDKGQTPFQSDDLPAGEYTLKLRSGERNYQTKITLTGGTQTVVKRELGPSETFSSGDILWFERTSDPPSVSVTSEPDGAQVNLDGDRLDKTPVIAEDLVTGNHDLQISFEGFETEKLTIKLNKGFKLRISSKLALALPASDDRQKIDTGNEKIALFRLSFTQESAYVDRESLVQGTIYLLQTRSGEQEGVWNYFLNHQGDVFDATGQTLVLDNLTDVEKVETIKVGYFATDEPGLSDGATASLASLAKAVLKEPPTLTKAKILPTGTDWLRVRAQPNLSAAEVTKVNVGESFEILEEETGWVKIKLPDGGEGWVSGDFVEKIQEAP